jgi:hypothetical protein
MTPSCLTFRKSLGLGLMCSTALLMSACGGSNSSHSTTSPTATPAPTATPGTTPAPSASPSASPTATPAPTASTGKVAGPLDPVQDEVVIGIIGIEIASQLPDPLDVTVACAASALNYLVDGPDAILAAASGLSDTQDPFAAFNSAQAQLQTSLELFAAQLQASLLSLADRGACDPASAPAAASVGNPFIGTPLEAVGVQLLALSAALSDSESDPNLTSVTSTLAPILAQLSAALAALPADLQNAPAIGGMINTLAIATADVSNLLPHVGNYDGANTAAEAANLVNNLLSNVMLGVLPVSDIDAASGQNFAGEIQNGINALSAQLGTSVGMVVTPLFVQGLDGALSPLLNPVEGLLAVILNPSEVDAGSGLFAITSVSPNALQGILAGAAGDGNVVGSSLDGLLLLLVANQGGLSLTDMVTGSGLTAGTQLGSLMTLTTDANAVQLDGILSDVLSFTSSPFSLSLTDALDTVVGSLLGGLI